MADVILAARDLDISYGRRRGRDTRVVREVSFTIEEGEVLALVGESGSGKTTVARAVAGLLPVTGGDLLFGADRIRLGMRRPHEVRRQIPMVFQDPRSSLNPRMTVEQIIREVWITHPDTAPKGDRTVAVRELLDRVGLADAVRTRRPGQLSGGQCQRISIARAVALRPRLLVCDEAVSALDVSVQAQILRLLVDLKTSLGISMLFITHDLGVVRQLADSVAVMEQGVIVEQGPTERVFSSPEHPYTQSLLAAALNLADEKPGR